MEQGQSSAEKELLKAIEGSMGTPPPQEAAPAAPPPPSEVPREVPASPATGKVELPINFSPKVFLQAIKFTPNEIARLLWAIIAVLVIWLSMVAVSGSGRANTMPKFDTVQLKPQQLMAKGVTIPLKDMSFYIESLLGRNIFTQFEERKADLGAAAQPKITEMAKDLRMAGISWAENEKDRFVMIEDTKTNVTYFLQEGDRLSNYFLIKSIYKDRVVLTHGQEEMELR